MKKRTCIMAGALAVMLAVPVSGIGGNQLTGYAAEAGYEVKGYDLPDEEELAANKALKELMEQWGETGEYPDYFASVVFCGDSLYPVIQLTDISEENKRDFLNKVGFEHEKWQFQQVPYSRDQLLEVCEQVKKQFTNDKRIEKIVVSDVVENGHTMVEYVVKDKISYEHRPSVDSQVEARVWVLAHNEYEYEVLDDVAKIYDEELVDVNHNRDDSIGDIVTEEAVVSGKIYKRQYQINDIRDWAYTAEYGFSPMGDFNKNGSLDLEDAREVLKAALNITKIEESRCFYLRYSEDHSGVNLSDAQELLKRALKIVDDWKPHVQILHNNSLYRSLEYGRTDMAVQQKVFTGREELLAYVKQLNNPELENYVKNLSDVYIAGQDVLLTARPVYAEDINSVNGCSYEMKETDNSWGIIAQVSEMGEKQMSEASTYYYLELDFVSEDIKDKPYEKFFIEHNVWNFD